MKGLRITTKDIAGFREHLILEERSVATIQKYIRDVNAFMAYAQNSAITKETVIAYKKYLQENLLCGALIPCWPASTVCLCFLAGTI